MSDGKTADDRVREYLVKSGLPLEMRVAGMFRKTMYSIQQSGSVDQRVTYLSPDGDSSSRFTVRETDVVVAARKMVTHSIAFQVRLVIECKSSKSQPWVLFRSLSPELSSAGVPGSALWLSWVMQRQGSGSTAPKLGQLTHVFERDLLNTHRPFCSGVESTHDVDKSGSKPNHARDALRQVLAAAVAINGTDQQHQPNPAIDAVGVTVPVVVTSADMFAVIGADDGSYEVHPTHRELVYNQFNVRGAAPVWIVDETGAGELVKEFLELQALADYQG